MHSGLHEQAYAPGRDRGNRRLARGNWDGGSTRATIAETPAALEFRNKQTHTPMPRV